MAGYMTKLQGYVYEGEYTNGTAGPVYNGMLLVLANDGRTLVLPSADTTTKLICKDLEPMYDGVAAARFQANVLNKTYYLVENLHEYNDATAYDIAEYAIPVGAKLRAHPILAGEEFVQATTLPGSNAAPATLVVGNAYGVKATGLVG